MNAATETMIEDLKDLALELDITDAFDLCLQAEATWMFNFDANFGLSEAHVLCEKAIAAADEPETDDPKGGDTVSVRIRDEGNGWAVVTTILLANGQTTMVIIKVPTLKEAVTYL